MTDVDFKTPDDKKWLLLVADALDDAPHLPNRCVVMSIEFAQHTATRLRAISKVLPDLDVAQSL